MAKDKIKDYERNKSIVYKAFKSGLDRDGIVAYHGTSQEVLEEILKNGFFPGSKFARKNGQVYTHRKGDVFVFPIKGRTNIKGSLSLYDNLTALKEARAYAKLNARTHYLLSKLGSIDDFSGETDLSEKFCQISARYENEISFYRGKIPEERKRLFIEKYFSKLELSKEELINIIESAILRRGVVIGFSSNIFSCGKPLNGDCNFDVRIIRPKIKDIIGVESYCDYSYNFLESLGSC